MFSEFVHRRIELYIAGVEETTVPGQCSPVAKKEILSLGALESRTSMLRRIRATFDFAVNSRYNNYFRAAQLHFSAVAPSSQFSLVATDNRARFTVPTILKSREIVDRDGKGVLLPLDWRRHWPQLGELALNDRPFEEKDNKLIWRGATTGRFHKDDTEDVYSSRFWAAHLTDLSPGIDIKFSKLVNRGGFEKSFPLEAVRSRLGAEMSMRELLSSKFLLCLEGNDVATGLKWMMGSFSTVIMPPPTCETWFCEGELVAWEHYVPVKSDLSDLNEIYEWCLSNPARCKEIALHGRAFAAQFIDARTEYAIIQNVVRSYLEYSDVDVTFSRAERFRQFWNHLGLRYDRRKFWRQFDDIKRGFGPVPGSS